MSYYINQIQSPTDNNVYGVIFDPKLFIKPKIINNLMIIEINLEIYGDFSLPVNTILLDLVSNFAEFTKIQLNLNLTKTEGFNKVFSSILSFNINESTLLFEHIHQNTLLTFIPKFYLDVHAMNEANLTIDNSNVQRFINEIIAINSTNIKKEYYYSNLYSLYDIFYNEIHENEINVPIFEVEKINQNINWNKWSYLFDFIKISNTNNIWIDQYFFKVNYYIFGQQKQFELKEKNFKTLFKSNFKTNYDYEKNEIILDDSNEGYNGIFIPYKTYGNISLSFKINSIWYHQIFDFNINQSLFGESGLFNTNILSYEQK